MVLSVTSLFASLDVAAIPCIFYGGSGLVNGKAAVTNEAPAFSSINTSSLIVTHADPAYECTGWYVDPDFTVYAGSYRGSVIVMVTAGIMTYYAKIEPDSYSIVLDANGGSGVMQPIAAVATRTVQLPKCDFTKPSCRFLGWSTERGGKVVYPDESPVVFGHDRNGGAKGDVTLYAVWGRQFTLKFNKNGGSGTMGSIVLDEGEPRFLPKCTFTPPTGCRFDGWYNAIIGEYQDGDEVVYDPLTWSGTTATLAAQWSPITYTIRFAANGPAAVSGAMPDVAVDYGDSQGLPLCAFKCAGYEFLGWAESADGEVVYADGDTVSDLATEDGAVVTLFARWAPIRYAVGFDGNGGSGAMEVIECVYDRACSLPAVGFKRTGAEFLGWSTNGENTVVYEDRATVSNLTTVAGSTNILKAVWSNIGYHVAFDGNGGGGAMDGMDCEYGVAFRLPSNDFVRVGHVFTGWSTNSSAAAVYAEGECVSNLTLVAGATVELFAAWRPVRYRVVFDPEGGEGVMPPQTNFYGVVFKLTENAFTKIGRAFSGWAADAGGEIVYPDGAVVSNLVAVEDGECLLHAVWVKALSPLNAALDNDELTILADRDGMPCLTVIDEPAAVNGGCVRFDRDSDNDGRLGFRVYVDSPGEFSFAWKVVNVYPPGVIPPLTHWDGFKVLVDLEAPEVTNHVLNVERGTDYENPVMDWEDCKVKVTETPASLHFTFPYLGGEYSTELYALFDNVRWSSEDNPEPTAADAPVIDGAAAVEGGRIRITFAADRRFRYELIRTGSLSPVDWQSFEPRLFLVPDADGDMSFEPEMKAAEPQMFYRVRVLRKD